MNDSFKPIRPTGPQQRLEQRVADLEQRVLTLERKLAAEGIDGWACPRCSPGWVKRVGDRLECTKCGYFRYL